MQIRRRIVRFGGNLGFVGLALSACLCARNASAWQIVGTVKDDAASPIVGVWVRAEGFAGETNYAIVPVMTEEDGSFRLEAFDGRWVLSLDWSALNSRGFLGASWQTIIVEGADEPIQFICPRVLYTMRLAGTVIDDQGGAVSNATVSVSALNEYYAASTNADTAGRFDLPLFGGFWDFRATANQPDQMQLLMPQIFVRTIDGIDQTNFVAVGRIPTAQVVVSMQHTFGTNLTVYGEVYAVATAGSTNYFAETWIDSIGNSTFSLSEGTWRLEPPEYPQVFVGSSARSVAIGIPDKTISVTGAQQMVTWTVRNSTNHLRGQLLDSMGAPISNSWVSAAGSAGAQEVRSGSWISSFPNYAGAFTSTDVDGRFDLTLFSGVWKVSATGDSTDGPSASLPNVGMIEGIDRTNLQIVVPRFTTQILGSLKTSSGLTLQRFRVRGSTLLNGEAFSTEWVNPDGQGNLRLPVFAGEWQVTGSYPLAGAYPPRSSSWLSPTNVVSVSHTNAIVELLADPPAITARLRGRVVDNAGAAVSQLPFFARNSEGSLRVLDDTGRDGLFTVEANGGSWTILMNNFQVDTGFYLGPGLSINVQDGVDQTNLLLVAQKSTARITGVLTGADGAGLAGVAVSASAQLQGTDYLVNSVTEQDGSFALEVVNGTWLVRVEDRTLNALDLQSLSVRTVSVAHNEETSFAAERIIGDGRVPALVRLADLRDGAIQLKVTSQTALPYRVDASADLNDWAPVMTNLTLNGSFAFTNRPVTVTPNRFYRAVLVE